MIPPPRNILVSYHYFRDYNLDRFAGLNIVGDSGAYSARMQGASISNADLAAWIKQWRDRLCWAASLDVAGDISVTRRNWHELVDGYGIPAISSLHVGVDPSEMDYYAQRGVDFLGLGGLAGSVTPPAVRFRWLVSVFRYARDHHPGMRFHGWGVTGVKALRLPFFSVDSSGWGAGYRYGHLALRDPRTGKTQKLRLDGRSTYTPEVASLLCDQYGVNPSQVSTSGPHNRLLMVRLSALSASVQEQQLRHLHRHNPITPPDWGRLSRSDTGPHMNGVSLPGPHLHLAEGSPEHLQIVADMAKSEG